MSSDDNKLELIGFPKDGKVREILPPGYIAGVLPLRYKNNLGAAVLLEPVSKGIYLGYCPEDIIYEIIEHETIHNILARDISYNVSKKFDFFKFTKENRINLLYKLAERTVSEIARKSEKPRNKRTNNQKTNRHPEKRRPEHGIYIKRENKRH